MLADLQVPKKRWSFLLGPAIIIAWAVCISGCASISPSGYKQMVLVRSEPEGAKILVDDHVVATTPAYVAIRRGRHPTFQIQDDDGVVREELQRHYRWRDSFLWNFLLYTAAPFGWGLDLLTGTAWQAEDPAPYPVHLRHPPKPDIWAAIAPPQSKSVGVSDSGGEAIEQNLRVFDPGLQIRPYLATLPTFLDQGYDYDGDLEKNARADLYGALGVAAVYESKVEYRPGEILLNVKRVGVYDGLESDPFTLKLKPEGDFESLFTSRRWWASLVPNTLALTFAEDKLQLTSGTQTYPLQSVGNHTWWDTGLTYLNAIDITNTPELRAGRAGRWAFGFVPALRAYRQLVRATGLPDEGEGSDEVFTRWRISTGYGPEVGYQFGRNYIYLDFVPYFFWSEISWSESSQYHSITNTGIDIGTEIGYQVLFDQHWVFKLFARTDNEDSRGWAEALQSRLPADASSSMRAQLVITGVSFGYRIEPEFNSHRFQR